ncbi:Replicase polyprotein 1a, partial [Linum perenne]
MNPSDKRKRTKKVVTSKRDVSKGKGVANTRAPSSKKKDDGKISEEDDEDAEDEGKDDGKAGDDNDDKGGDDDHSEKDDGKGVDNSQASSSKNKDDGKITEEDDEDAEDEGKDDGKAVEDAEDEGKDDGKAVEDEGKDDGKAVEDNDSDEDDDNDKGGDDDHSDEDDDNDGGATATGDAVDPEGELNADANVNTPPRNIDSVVDERRTATTPSKNPDVLVDIGSLLCSPSVVNSVIEETVKQIATEHPPSPMVNAAAGGVQDSPIEKVIVRSTGCLGNLIEAADALVELNDPGQSSTILDDPNLVRPIPVTPLTTLYSNAFVPDTYSTDGRKNSMPETSSFSFSDFRAKIYQYATSKDLASDEILVKLKGSKILVRRNDMMTLLPNQDISIQTVDAYSDLLNRRSVHDGKASRWIFPQQFSELIFSQIEDSQTSPYDAAKEFKKFLHNEWSKKVDFSDVKL